MSFDTHLLDEALVQHYHRLENERRDLLAQTLAALNVLSCLYGIRRAYIFGSVVSPTVSMRHQMWTSRLKPAGLQC